MLVLEGIDGVGKTSLAVALAKTIGGHHRSPKTILNPHPHVQWSARQLSEIIWPTEERKQYANILPGGYWSGLQLAWYSLLSDDLKTSLRDGGDTVCDGWIYKFAAKLVVEGYSPETVEGFLRAVPAPGQTVLVTAEVSEVWRRRQQFSAYEMGALSGYRDLGRESFVEYQEKVQAALVAMASRFGWSRLFVEANEPFERTLANLVRLIDA